MRKVHLSTLGICGFIVALSVIALASFGTQTRISAAVTATPNPAIPIFTPAPRGPTVVPAPAGPNGTAIPPGGYQTLPDGRPLSALTSPPANAAPQPGIPAITPRNVTTDALTPAFTAQDAIGYATTHDVGLKVSAQGPVSVVNVSFLPARDATTLFHRKLPLDDTRLLCVVQVSGNFSISSAPGGTDEKVTGAYEIFDAHSGNRLMVIA